MNKKVLLSITLIFIIIVSNSIVLACVNESNIYRENIDKGLKKEVINIDDKIVKERITVSVDENYGYLQSKAQNIKEYTQYEEEIRSRILDVLNNLEDIVYLSEIVTNRNQIDAQGISNIYYDIIDEYENPEIFYSKFLKAYIDYWYYPHSGEVTKCNIEISYLEDKETINEMKVEFNNKIAEIQRDYLDGVEDELQLQYIIHDYILNNTTYTSGSDIVYTSYGSLVNGQSVCEGYAKAAKLLFNLVGIQSGIIISPEMNHAWNYVKINDKYYHMDVTWDDPIPETNRVRYTYFNRSDEEIAETHTWDSSLYPKCIGEEFRFLRGYEVRNIARVEDKLYFYESKSNYNNIYSSSLNGQDKKSEISEIKANNFVSHNNELYFVNNTNYYKPKVVKYNLTTKEIVEMYESDEQIHSIYIKDEILYIKDWNYKTVQIEIGQREDINRDGVINIIDLATMALRYGKNNTSIVWNKIYDINLDNIIDIYDLIKIASKIK